MNRAVVTTETIAPHEFLTNSADKELRMVYGSPSIPYETYAVLAAMFPKQSAQNPINNEDIGKLETVIKFRDCTGYLMKNEVTRTNWLQEHIRSRIAFLQELADKLK